MDKKWRKNAANAKIDRGIVLKQSKMIRVWNLLYPVCMYYAITVTTLAVLDFVLPESVDSKLLRQFITTFAVLPFLISCYRQDLGGKKERASRKNLAVMFLTGACFAVAFNNLLGMVRIADYSPSYDQVEQTFYTGRLPLEFAALCIVIPIAEELLYRGIVYRRGADWLGDGPAMILSAAIFGLAHMNLAQFVYASAFGILLAYFTREGGTVLGAVAAHMAANLTSVLRAETEAFAFMEKSFPARLVITAALFAASAAGVFRVRRDGCPAAGNKRWHC